MIRYYLKLWHYEIDMFWSKQVSRETYEEMKGVWEELGHQMSENIATEGNTIVHTITVYNYRKRPNE